MRLYRRTKLAVSVTQAIDCRDVAALGLTQDALLADDSYAVGQALGLAAVRRGAEGILVPSATQAGDNLILFPDNLLQASHITITADTLELTHFVVS